jgi:hypothetical protein
MDKTPFSKRVEILYNVYLTQRDTDLEDFISSNDLGFPAAVLLTLGAVTPTTVGEGYINKTFDALCNYLDVDNLGDYDSFDNFWEIANG